jgi:hypothetical protein
VEFIEFGYGNSSDKNSLKAGAHATSDALKMMNKYSEKPNIAFLSSSSEYDPEEVLNGVKLILGNKTPIVGTSSKYQISGKTVDINSVSVGILGSKYFNVGMGVCLGASIHPKECGRKAVKDAVKNLGMMPKLIYVISDFCEHEEHVLKGIIEEVGVTIPVFGAVSSDSLEFEKTYQYGNDVYIDSIVCVAFGGDIVPKISYGRYLESGKNAKTVKNIITKSDKRTIKEINKMPALKKYLEISGFEGIEEDIAKNPEFYLSNPLGIMDTNGDIHLKGPIYIKNDEIVTGSNIRSSNELKVVNVNEKTVEKIFTENIEVLKNTLPNYSPVVTFSAISSYLLEVHPKLLENLVKSHDIGPVHGFSSFGEMVFGRYENYSITMCSLTPDLVSISAKEGIHMFTKHPATKETLLKINELGGSVKVEELGNALGIHRRSAYDRVEPLLKYGFSEKEGALITITELGRLLLKFDF